MPETEKRMLKVHKDISSRFRPPYWDVEVRRDPKFPLDQYVTPIRNQSNKNDIYKIGDIQYPCGYCNSENPKLIWVNVVACNAGDFIGYEFRCEKCGVYTFYKGPEYS